MSEQLVLSSTSLYRRELMQRLNIPFSTASPNIDETRMPNEMPEAMVQRLALEKAKAVADKHPQAWIIGSDQCAVLGEHILGKPGDHASAVQQLQHSSGKAVHFLTSLCLYNAMTQQIQQTVVPYQVTFRILSLEEIETYLKLEKPYNCAGSIKSEGLGISLLSSMQGTDPTALIGLPLIHLCGLLRQAGFHIPSQAH